VKKIETPNCMEFFPAFILAMAYGFGVGTRPAAEPRQKLSSAQP
jgi:hypothetical protein